MRISSSSLPQPTAHFSDGTRLVLCSGPPPEPRRAEWALLKTCNQFHVKSQVVRYRRIHDPWNPTRASMHMPRHGAQTRVAAWQLTSSGSADHSLCREGIFRQLHDPEDRGEVRHENHAPSLQSGLIGFRAGGPWRHLLNELVDLLLRGPTLVGGVDVNRNMPCCLAAANIGNHAVEFGLLPLLTGHGFMLGLPAIVARLQGRQINLRQEVMIADTEATDFGDPVLLRLFFSLGGHGGTPSMQWAKSATCFWPHG